MTIYYVLHCHFPAAPAVCKFADGESAAPKINQIMAKQGFSSTGNVR